MLRTSMPLQDVVIVDKMILMMLAIERRDFCPGVENQKQHCFMFVVLPKHHSQNDVHVALDTPKILHRPSVSVIVE